MGPGASRDRCQSLVLTCFSNKPYLFWSGVALKSMFSVLIPIYNHAAFLNQAIESALCSPLVTEVLLMDDGSSDGSGKIAAKMAASEPRIRNLTPPGGGNRGTHYRLNELVGAARCDWVAVLNSDDAFAPGRFEVISSDPSFSQSDFVFGDLKLIGENGEPTGSWGVRGTGTPFPFDVADMVRSGRFLELLSNQNYVRTTTNMLFRRDLHARIGGFGPYRYVHDWDFALRAMALGRTLYVQQEITIYRMHSRNTILESAAKVNLGCKDVLDRFAADFPQVAARPEFRLGLERNIWRSADEREAQTRDVQRLVNENFSLREEFPEMRSLLEDKDRELAEVRESLEALRQESARAQALAAEKGRLLAEHGQQLAERERFLEEERRRSAEQAAEITRLCESLEERACVIAELQTDSTELRKGLAEHRTQLSHTRSGLQAVEASLRDVYASRSWLVTRPLRAAYDLLRNLHRGLLAVSRAGNQRRIRKAGTQPDPRAAGPMTRR